MTEYKVSLIGPSEFGKSSFIKRIDYGYNHIYASSKTKDVDIIPIYINKNNHNIKLNVWDCAGDLKNRRFDKGYHKGTRAAIIFRKTNNDEHRIFEDELPKNTPKLYIDDYNFKQPKYTLNEYKSMLYDLIIDNKH